ncbi:MAG: helix-turn-helix domain-containing protein [Candidatus Hermodarchaeota archaeon]
MILTHKVRISPTAAQQSVLWDLANLCRQVYNLALGERRFFHHYYGTAVSYQAQQNALPQLKAIFPQYKQVYSKVLQLTLKKVDNAYKSFYGLRKAGDPTAKPPRFRSH